MSDEQPLPQPLEFIPEHTGQLEVAWFVVAYSLPPRQSMCIIKSSDGRFGEAKLPADAPASIKPGLKFVVEAKWISNSLIWEVVKMEQPLPSFGVSK
jgi:hypothetical protein